jgi:triphosphoribosyl-dephospho-CoA synthase
MRSSVLAARDGRQAAIDLHLGAWPAVVAVSLGLPGPRKTPPGCAELFAWAVSEVSRTVPGAREIHAAHDALGPFAVLRVPGDPREAKRRCVAIEAAHAGARLVDLDVYAQDGAIDRASLRLPPRACLCCGAPARECIRLSRHAAGALEARAATLLAGWPLERLSSALVDGLGRELALTPKPGLVDLEDRGSHPDLSVPLMRRSIALVGAYLAELSASVAAGEPLPRQVAIGRAAERRMLAALGTNTHKGAIFLGGLLVLGRHRAGGDGEGAVREALSGVARALAAEGRNGTNGGAARRRYHVGGIVEEAAAGLPSVFEVALPALRDALRRGRAEDEAAFAALARLMQTVEDTTALHRCGEAGLARLRADGARLAELVEAGAGGHVAYLRERNAAYRRMNLTMGGVADLLGVALGWLVHLGELPRRAAEAAPCPPS